MIEIHYKDNYRRYVNIAKRFLRCSFEDAEDVVQEAYYRAFKYKDSFNEKIASYPTWFNRIFTRSLKDFRKSEFNKSSYVDIEEVNITTPEDSEEWRTKYRELNKYIESLNGIRKQICYLYFIRGFPIRDIVKITSCNRHKIENDIKFNRRKIKELLEDDIS